MEEKIDLTHPPKKIMLPLEAGNLKLILQALQGPPYLMREFAVIDDLAVRLNTPETGSPIMKLFTEYNAAVKRHNAVEGDLFDEAARLVIEDIKDLIPTTIELLGPQFQKRLAHVIRKAMCGE